MIHSSLEYHLVDYLAYQIEGLGYQYLQMTCGLFFLTRINYFRSKKEDKI